MYVIKIFRQGEWESWASAANPRLINMFIDLVEKVHPGVPYCVDGPR